MVTPKTPAARQVALEIVKTLQKHGFEAFWVGGCVRNLLLSKEPEDYDIATAAHPDEVKQLFPKHREVGVKFGVVLVLSKGVAIEVATFRRDDVYEDHRHPREVHFSTACEDASRRDFTINALFFNPLTEKVIDYVGGQQDLKDKTIRAVGDPRQRFQEDALRMLRAVRFAFALDFVLEPGTSEAIGQCAPLIKEVSAERIREELTKIFTQPRAGDALQLLSELSLLREILPEVEEMKGIPQPPGFHPEGDVFTHTVLAMNLLEQPSTTLAFATLLHDVGKPLTMKIEERVRFNGHDKEGADITRRICRRLKFSRQEIETIVALVERHMYFLNVQRMRQSRLRRFLSAPTIEEDLELHRVDCLASNGDLDNYHFCLEKLKEFEQEGVVPEPLLRGQDLIDMGYQPGPRFKRILTAVEEKQLEGELHSSEEARRFVRQKFPHADGPERQT